MFSKPKYLMTYQECESFQTDSKIGQINLQSPNQLNKWQIKN
jgi:hypothetical protein